MPSKAQRRHEKRLAERRANEEKVHKQVILDWLNKLNHDYDVVAMEEIVAAFQEEFDFWPEQFDDGQMTALLTRGPSSMARSSDPGASKKAAYDAYPRAGSQRRKALVAIILSGVTGMHYAEVERETGIRGVWKRLSELHEGGWIKVENYTRRVAATGSYAQVYTATEKAIKAFAEEARAA